MAMSYNHVHCGGFYDSLKMALQETAMHYISLVEAGNQLAGAVSRVASAQERVMLTHHGKELAAVVSMASIEDVKALMAKNAPAGEL